MNRQCLDLVTQILHDLFPVDVDFRLLAHAGKLPQFQVLGVPARGFVQRHIANVPIANKVSLGVNAVGIEFAFTGSNDVIV